jgi:hypothetical protein
MRDFPCEVNHGWLADGTTIVGGAWGGDIVATCSEGKSVAPMEGAAYDAQASDLGSRFRLNPMEKYYLQLLSEPLQAT